MKPYLHAELSVKKWGGRPEDYMPIHDFIDSSKAHFPDIRHRALLHSSFGIYLAERVFGTNIRITKAKPGVVKPCCDEDFVLVSVRDIAEQHVLQDLGYIPTVQDYLQHLPIQSWMGGKKKKPTIRISMSDIIVD